MKLKELIKAIYDEDARFLVKNKLGFCDDMPDDEYLKRKWRHAMGKELDLDNPKTFNEKLQWLKLYDRRPEYTIMVDKYLVKDYIANKIGQGYIIPTLGVWERFEDIDFKELPKQFVLKTTHDSGGVIICKDKFKFNITKARRIINKSLKRNYYFEGREWPYKNVHPRIIAEQYLEDSNTGELPDYKVLCFNGEPKFIEVHKGRFTGIHTQDFYDEKWVKTDISQAGMPMSDLIMPKPIFLEEMLDLSKKISKGIIHVRVDWYYVYKKLYFGEITFYDGSGYDKFNGNYDEKLGGLITCYQSNEMEVVK